MKSVSDINQSEKAKEKLAAIAKNNGLNHTLVSYLFSFHWKYDGREGTWVKQVVGPCKHQRMDVSASVLVKARNTTLVVWRWQEQGNTFVESPEPR